MTGSPTRLPSSSIVGREFLELREFFGVIFKRIPYSLGWRFISHQFLENIEINYTEIREHQFAAILGQSFKELQQ